MTLASETQTNAKEDSSDQNKAAVSTPRIEITKQNNSPTASKQMSNQPEMRAISLKTQDLSTMHKIDKAEHSVISKQNQSFSESFRKSTTSNLLNMLHNKKVELAEKTHASGDEQHHSSSSVVV